MGEIDCCHFQHVCFTQHGATSWSMRKMECELA